MSQGCIVVLFSGSTVDLHLSVLPTLLVTTACELPSSVFWPLTAGSRESSPPLGPTLLERADVDLNLVALQSPRFRHVVPSDVIRNPFSVEGREVKRKQKAR